MMRPCLFLAAIVLGAAQTPAPVPGKSLFPGMPPVDKAFCAIHSVTVADDLMNSIIYIWQGVLRCGEGHNKAECSVDVSYAIQAVTLMINTINKAVNGCGQIMDNRAQCGIAIGEVTASMAGVAGASSAIAEDCPEKHLGEPVHGLGEALSGTSGHFSHNLATCIIDSKRLFFMVIRASAQIADASEQCKTPGDKDCADAVIKTTIAVAAMGEMIAGVVGTCTKPDNQQAKCAAGVLGLLRNLVHMSNAGKALDGACEATAAERLFLENGGSQAQAQAPTKDNLPTFALAMLLPITAVMSFVAGRRMAKSQRTPTYDAEAGEE